MNLFELLTLLFKTLFGSNLTPVAEDVPVVVNNPAPEPVPVAPTPVPTLIPAAPQIIVPDPANRDDYGPASALVRALKAKGHAVFEKDDQAKNLNIVAVRTVSPEFDRFRCRLVHFEKHQGEWSMRSWPVTTLPGHYYTIVKLLNKDGVAILAPGQYRGVYALDRHRSLYEALCQRNGTVRVFRDGNRDRVYDMIPSSIQSGEFGMNVHATENPDDGISNNFADIVGSSSAGCIVFARVTDFVEARKEWREAKLNFGPSFTLTLIDDNDLDDPGTIPHESLPPQVSDNEAWKPSAPYTLGIRNRNLLNVKQNPRNPWKYSTGADSKGHTIFPNHAAGLRAGIINLRTYWTTHRLRTLGAICGRWAPSSDTIGSIAGNAVNRPDKYASYLARRVGVNPTDTLMLFNDQGRVRSADQLYGVVSGMAIYENHAGVILPRSVFDEALAIL
jgi:hypothetical protein